MTGRLIVAGMVLLLASLPSPAVRADEAAISLASDGNSFAFEMRDGIPSGFLATLIEDLASAVGRRVDFHIRPWARCLEEARNGDVDGVFAVYRLPEREKLYLYSRVPLYLVQEHIYVRRDEGFDARDWQDRLRGKRVGVLNASYHGPRYQEALAQHLFGAVELANSTESLLAMLRAGRIDAIFTTSDLMQKALAAPGVSPAVTQIEPAVEAMPVYLAFTRKRDLTGLRDAIDRELDKMKEDGRYDALLHHFYP